MFYKNNFIDQIFKKNYHKNSNTEENSEKHILESNLFHESNKEKEVFINNQM